MLAQLQLASKAAWQRVPCKAHAVPHQPDLAHSAARPIWCQKGSDCQSWKPAHMQGQKFRPWLTCMMLFTVICVPLQAPIIRCCELGICKLEVSPKLQFKLRSCVAWSARGVHMQQMSKVKPCRRTACASAQGSSMRTCPNRGQLQPNITPALCSCFAARPTLFGRWPEACTAHGRQHGHLV